MWRTRPNSQAASGCVLEERQVRQNGRAGGRLHGGRHHRFQDAHCRAERDKGRLHLRHTGHRDRVDPLAARLVAAVGGGGGVLLGGTLAMVVAMAERENCAHVGSEIGRVRFWGHALVGGGVAIIAGQLRAHARGAAAVAAAKLGL